VVFIRDYAHSRAADMVEMGVSRAVAPGAVERLEEQWLDDMIAQSERLPRDNRAEWLESVLSSAINDPHQRHKRLHPPWVDHQGFTASVYSGLWANTPWPRAQIHRTEPSLCRIRCSASYILRSRRAVKTASRVTGRSSGNMMSA